MWIVQFLHWKSRWAPLLATQNTPILKVFDKFVWGKCKIWMIICRKLHRCGSEISFIIKSSDLTSLTWNVTFLWKLQWNNDFWLNFGLFYAQIYRTASEDVKYSAQLLLWCHFLNSTAPVASHSCPFVFDGINKIIQVWNDMSVI